MADLAWHLNEPANHYETLVEQARAGFARFWNETAGYCYDVIDGPDGDDPALRPNQLLAASLPHSPLSVEQQRAEEKLQASVVFDARIERRKSI